MKAMSASGPGMFGSVHVGFACECCSALYAEDLPACPACGLCTHPESEKEVAGCGLCGKDWDLQHLRGANVGLWMRNQHAKMEDKT